MIVYGARGVIPVDMLAVGAHPDDLEIGMGGTIARLAAAGRRIGLVDLTRGE
ncbi:MAG TPA: PIG-L family deacetylase, partial [Acidobacteriota bacterium]|nr:PIG-L family deacetylase [Acidobacteriota bacterium]